MSEFSFLRGEIVLYNGNDTWVQFIEDTDEGIMVYDGLSYFICEDNEIEKASLPLGLDGLGFKHKYRTFKILETDGKYFVNNIEVIRIDEVQEIFSLYSLISFNTLDKRLSKISKLEQ